MSENNEIGINIQLETEKLKPEISKVIAEVGLDMEKIAPRILERLELLNRETMTIKDGERAIEIARDIFAYYETQKEAEAWSDVEKKITLVGSIFSDIGKTGPREATPEQQMLVTTMFGVENVKNPQMSVADFFKMYFPETAEEKMRMFQEMSLDSNMTMRTFWNLHSLWTLQIISGDGVPKEAIAGAAAHHIIEGINPDNIMGLDGKFEKYFGENASFDRPEKLIIILDKFDAFCRRAGKTPQEAIEGVRERIMNNTTFGSDREFHTLLDDLAEVISLEK